MSTLENPVPAMLDAYKAAVYAKDVAAFAVLYDTNVQIFDMWGEWIYRGIDAWQAMAAGWFDSLGTDRVVVGVEDLHVQLAQDLVAAHAFLTYTAVSAEGKELRAMNNRLTLVLKKIGEGWKIVHEHTSAPADFGTSKLMLKH